MIVRKYSSLEITEVITDGIPTLPGDAAQGRTC